MHYVWYLFVDDTEYWYRYVYEIEEIPWFDICLCHYTTDKINPTFITLNFITNVNYMAIFFYLNLLII